MFFNVLPLTNSSTLFSVQGVKAVISESFERIHRSNLVGMGIMPLEYLPGENAESLGLTGKESYTIEVPEDLQTGQVVDVKVEKQAKRPYYDNGIFSRIHWLIFIVNNWTDTCDVAACESEQFDKLLSYKANGRQFFTRLSCY